MSVRFTSVGELALTLIQEIGVTFSSLSRRLGAIERTSYTPGGAGGDSTDKIDLLEARLRALKQIGIHSAMGDLNEKLGWATGENNIDTEEHARGARL
jgi:hypothetical protein